MRILVINTGSSSIKYELFDMDGPESLATGLVERIGEPQSRLEHRLRNEAGTVTEEAREEAIADHGEGLRKIADFLSQSGLLRGSDGLDGIGHRVVHGGEKFQEPTLLNDEVVARIEEQSPLAPLHNPANLRGIETTRETWPKVPQVAVFDTAFHQTIPAQAYLYAIPYDYYARLGIRRYGFHGTSHQFVAKAVARHLNRPLDSLKLITIHLGNGASAAAIRNGKCVETSMGLTPLEGLIMGTRSGDIDPAILPFLAEQERLTLHELDEMLNRESGLKGVCGANDMREILKRVHQGDSQASLALKM
ncbi:MAG: acetate kinase, partial [Planctomycetaceae bacterium]|nr:acetate kinase [Planctomycetaceae bacterium]